MEIEWPNSVDSDQTAPWVLILTVCPDLSENLNILWHSFTHRLRCMYYSRKEILFTVLISYVLNSYCKTLRPYQTSEKSDANFK